jgi:dipeptidyl aminopeptidase/acylaminoacyl peptidase
MTEPSTPPGAWPSPISAADVARGGVLLGAVALDSGGRRVWWSEGRPGEGGRVALLRRRSGEDVEELAPALSARTRVHEYGGGAWVPVGDGAALSSWADQRLWLVPSAGAEPVALTPESGGRLRYADAVVVGDALVCVREDVGGSGEDVRRALVRVPLDGSGRVVELFSGPRFLAAPRPSPDGTALVWVSWDHPDMPWQRTRLWRADLGPDGLGSPRVVAGGGGARESLVQPGWTAGGDLLVVSDRSGWWNLQRVGLGDEAGEDLVGDLVPVLPGPEEQGWPHWAFGTASWAPLADGRVALVHGTDTYRLDVVDPATGQVTPLGLPFTAYRPVLAASGSAVAAVAGSATTPYAVVVVDVAGPGGSVRADVVRPALDAVPDPAHLPVPRSLDVPSAGGRSVHAHHYPPTSPVAGAAGGPAPHVLFVHGGPTSQSQAAYSPEVAFFTSRGIGVVDVNYGGSTGYGRAYREALDGAWGVVDVEDCVAVARWLVEQGLAPAGQVGIRGGSAGGFTVLAALTGTDAFTAGASSYGVADLRGLAEDTHDFESRYLDGLVGPLPEAAGVYAERAPLDHVDGLSCPVLLLQGSEDLVVPPAQAEAFAAALRRKGLPHALVVFEGEQHGFRRAETVARALEAELSFYGQVWGFEPPGVPVLPLER